MTQRYLLDTNVISHIMQGRDAKLLAKLSKLPIGQAAISSVTLAEIEYGIHRRGSEKLRNALDASDAAHGRLAMGCRCRDLLWRTVQQLGNTRHQFK
jgi:predicted nucleic acid-binding protein